MRSILSSIAVSLVLLLSGHALGQPTCELPVSAYLTDAAGAPLTGVLDVELRFFVEPGDGAEAAECRTFDAAPLDRGWLRLAVDGCAEPTEGDCGVAPLATLFDSAPGVWVGVWAGDEELAGRIPVGAVPFAFRAGDADALGGLVPGEFAATDDLAAHAADADAHHSATSDGLTITPSSVTVGETQIDSGRVDLGPDATDELTDEIVRTLTGGGDADALHGHAASGHGTAGCYSAWGTTTCAEGFSAATSGIASVFFWSGGAGGQPFCIDSTSIEGVNPGWPGSGYFGLLPISNTVRSVDLAIDDLACVVCCRD